MTFLLLGTIEVLTEPFVAITIIGTATVGLAFLVGRALFGGRRALPSGRTFAAPPAPPLCPPRESSDPFILGSSGELRSSMRRTGSVIEVRIADALGETELGRGVVVDRSTGGLGLEVNVRLERGSVVSIRPSRAEQRSPWIQIEIMSCEGEENSWRVGCKFVRTPPWSVMLLFW
jgi:hypothetical protein